MHYGISFYLDFKICERSLFANGCLLYKDAAACWTEGLEDVSANSSSRLAVYKYTLTSAI